MNLSNRASKDLGSILDAFSNASEAASKCSALIHPLYQYSEELEQGSTPKAVKQLIKLIRAEFETYKAEINKYWNSADRPRELFEKADSLQEIEFELGFYIKIFMNCDWRPIGEGGPSIGIRILERLANHLSESITLLHIEAHRLNQSEKLATSKAP